MKGFGQENIKNVEKCDKIYFSNTSKGLILITSKAEKEGVSFMTDAEKLRIVEMEKEKLMEENSRLHKVIERLNQTLNRLIGRYISTDKIA
ncbi:MAG: hypothetical protein PWP53_4276 [Lacrimispora sp.]|jgi:hypothetical protein|nr:hypothetical protein [Lacrimispora sp.]